MRRKNYISESLSLKMSFFRKTLFAILVCVICVRLDAQTRVALIPIASELVPVADQVLAAMSNDSDLEFLERANIEKVLSERKLNAAGLTGSNVSNLGKITHADLFAVILARFEKKRMAAPFRPD